MIQRWVENTFHFAITSLSVQQPQLSLVVQWPKGKVTHDALSYHGAQKVLPEARFLFFFKQIFETADFLKRIKLAKVDHKS